MSYGPFVAPSWIWICPWIQTRMEASVEAREEEEEEEEFNLYDEDEEMEQGEVIV